MKICHFDVLIALLAALVTVHSYIPVCRHGRKGGVRSKWLARQSNTDEADEVFTSLPSELPLDFLNAVDIAASSTSQAIKNGRSFLRIDFDTSIGDMTYTSLQQTLPFLKEYCKRVAYDLQILQDPFEEPVSETFSSDLDDEERRNMMKSKKYNMSEVVYNQTIRIFFPDMGAAVLSKNQWKLGTTVSEVPNCISTCNVQNDPLLSSDVLAVVVCPLYSETDSVKRVMELCEMQKTAILLINPQLINMDQGFGVRARNLRKEVLSKFDMVYKLKTLREGAVVKEKGRPFTLYLEDSKVDDGYTFVKNFAKEPGFEEIEEAFELKRAGIDPNTKDMGLNKKGKGVVDEVLSFFQGLSRL